MALTLAGASGAGAGEAATGVDQPTTSPGRAGKERLSSKANDEQRVDNSKVPPALRGSKPRPEGHGADAVRASFVVLEPPSRQPAAPRGASPKGCILERHWNKSVVKGVSNIKRSFVADASS